MYGTVKNAPIYIAPETPMMSSVIADCPDLVPPNILDKSTPMHGILVCCDKWVLKQWAKINQSIFVYLMYHNYITTVKTQLRFTKKA